MMALFKIRGLYSLLLHRFDAFDIRFDHHGIIGVVDDKAGGSARNLLYVLALDVVDFNFFTVPVFGIVGSQPGRFFKSAVGQFVTSGFYDDMGAGDAFGMEPPVAAGSKFKGQFFVLEIIFSHIHMVAIGRKVMQRRTGQFLFFGIFSAGVTFDIAGLDQLFFNLGQIAFGLGQVQSRADGIQMFEFLMGFFGEGCQGFKGPF